MCVDRIASIAVLAPGDEQPPTTGSPTSHQPIPFAFRIWNFLACGIGHRLFDFGNGDASLWVILLDVLPIDTVPDDRPIVHGDQYILLGYTLDIGVASGI